MNSYVDMGGGDYATDLQRLQRQQQIADMLQRQSLEPVEAPQGAVAPIHFTNVLAKALQGWAANRQQNRVDQRYQQLGQQDRDSAQGLIRQLTQGTNQVGMPAVSPMTSQVDATAPWLPGGPAPMPVTASVAVPGTPGEGMQTVGPSRAEQLAAVLSAQGGPQTQAMRGALLPGLMKQQDADIERQRLVTALGGAKTPPGVDPAAWQQMVQTQPDQAQKLQEAAMLANAKPELTDVMKNAAAMGLKQGTPEYNKFIQDNSRAGITQYVQGQENNRAANRQGSGNQYNLSDEENNALFGPQGSVTRGLMNPERLNSRTAHIFAKAAMTNPDLNMVNAAGVAALMKNPTFQNKVMVANSLPAVITNVTEAGKKVDFSDINYIGKLQAWGKGQLNDPDFIGYMTQRNDAMMGIASVMRGVGMSDKAIEQELKAAPETMSPKAWDAWSSAQMKSLTPRLSQYSGVTLNTSPGGATSTHSDAAPAHPGNIPPGSLYSPSRKQYKTPDGKLLDQNGSPI